MDTFGIPRMTNYSEGSATVASARVSWLKDMFSMIHAATWLGPGGG